MVNKMAVTVWVMPLNGVNKPFSLLNIRGSEHFFKLKGKKHFVNLSSFFCQMIAEVPLTIKMSAYVATWYSISEHVCGYIEYC